MPELPSRIRLAAGDYFMHGQDRRMRRLGLAGNVCRVAIELGGRLDADLLRQKISSSPMLDWLTRVRIVRSLPLFPPQWRALPESPQVLVEHNGEQAHANGEAQIPAWMSRDLHPAEGLGLGLDLVRRADKTDQLVLSWNHSLMDVRGAELVLRHLNPVNGDKGTPGLEDLINPEQQRGGIGRWWRNIQLAHGSMKWLRDSGREPLFSLLPKTEQSGESKGHTRLLSFTADETARINDRCEKLNAGFRRSHFYLASSIRALHKLARKRGNKEGAYLAPVPHDMRRRGSKGPIFSNHLSILFYRIEPSQAESLKAIIDELSQQMMEQIRTKFPECCMAALDMFKPLPLDYYVRHLGKPTGGKFASLCFSDSGETCAGMTEFFGAPIREVTHVVPTWRPPGLTTLFWSFRGQLRALVAWVEDCLNAAEADQFANDLRASLLEEET